VESCISTRRPNAAVSQKQKDTTATRDKQQKQRGRTDEKKNKDRAASIIRQSSQGEMITKMSTYCRFVDTVAEYQKLASRRMRVQQ